MLLTRFCLATRLNCLARYLPTAISQPALGTIDELLIATVAGCAGEDSVANLTAAVQGRTMGELSQGPRRQHLPSTSAPWRPLRASSSRRGQR